MLQFPRFDFQYYCTGIHKCVRFSFGHLGIIGCVRLPRAYRSLPRPSSLLKPSNPPIGVFTPVNSATYYTTMHDDHCKPSVNGPLHPSYITFVMHCIDDLMWRLCTPVHFPCLRRWSDRRFPYGHLVTTFPLSRTSSSITPIRRHLAKSSLQWNDGRCVQGAGTYSPRDNDTQLLGIPYSWGRVAALSHNCGNVWGLPHPFGFETNCRYHCSPRVAPEFRGILTCRGPFLPPH